MVVTVVPKTYSVSAGPHCSPMSLHTTVMTYERCGPLTQLKIVCTPGLFIPQ